MSLTHAIFRKSVFFFTLIPIFAVWGFWQTYFVATFRPLSGFDHLHGIAMFGWCLMLIVQSLLIRQSQRGIHRIVGRFSFVLVPWIAISTLMLANHQLNVRGLTGEGVYVLMLQVSILVQFIIFYSLAIVNRKRPDVHARYMVCTALPLLDPIFARVLVFNYLTPEQIPLAQFYTYPFTALILAALVIWDWRASDRRDVFFPMLFVLVALQLPTFFVTETAAWLSFAAWYMKLPLS